MNISEKMKYDRISLGSCTWIMPEGCSSWVSDKGVRFHNASWCISVSNRGITFLDDSMVQDPSDKSIELIKGAIDYALEIYRHQYTNH